MYGVSARTVEQWLTSAHRRILAETRRALADRLRLAPSELDSIMGLAQSELDLTLPSILATRNADEG